MNLFMGVHCTGVDTLKVTELQTYSTIGDTFTVTCYPTVKHPQGFSAAVDMVLSPAEKKDGCCVSATVILECQAAVWGVQGTQSPFAWTHFMENYNSPIAVYPSWQRSS